MPTTPYERLPQEREGPSRETIPSTSSSRRPSPQRPPTYYGHGSFDPPSSDEEDDAFLEKNGPSTPGIAERGRMGDEDEDEGTGLVLGGGQKQRPSSLRWLIISLVTLIVLAGCIGIFAARAYTHTSDYHPSGVKRITMDHIFNGTFSADRKSINWVPEAGDGVFSIWENDYIKLVDLKTNTTSVLVNTKDVKDERGNRLYWAGWALSPDMKYILLKSSYLKQWRHSSFGNYYVHHIETKSTHPIIPPSDPPVTSYATWSPTGESIAFVAENDLYVLQSPSPTNAPIRVTSSGNASLFHGVPDWVYEEEVFSSDYALWWSPDSSKVAFLALDETQVDEYVFPIYNPTENSSAVIPYTKDVVMKYPKPGYSNPFVTVHVFDLERYEELHALGFPAAGATAELDWPDRHPKEDSIISEVAWVGNATLILREVNRAADDGNVVMFDINLADESNGSTGQVVRKRGKKGEEGDDGWIESDQFIYPLPPSISAARNFSSAYLDIVPNADGYNHIALFPDAKSGKPYFLTYGEWEVTGGIQAIDAAKGLVYFQAANPSAIERNIYSVPIPASISVLETPAELNALTDPSEPNFYTASFSPEAGFYMLSYQGPNIPWQRIVQTNDASFDYVLTDNASLNKTWEQFEAPVISYSTIQSEGFELSVKEIRPPRMDTSGRTKYPVLFRVYGGPGSQMTDIRFNRDWDHYVTCGLQYIVAVVDGRGTGFKGRKLRNPVRNNLGFYETRDQINAAKIWAAKDYVDPKRIGIWGWSYGGFMSSKIMEAGAGVHSLAMAVAPVTSWRLYDSIYTERYMNLPDINPGGYINASISNVTAFHGMDYLLAHGSGDDNVHFANSAHLLDMLTREQVRGFRFRMFTDSDHSISRRGAYRELHEYLTEFLVEKWGKGGRRRRW